MADALPRPVRAWLDSVSSGIIEFDRDWDPRAAPLPALGAGAPPLTGSEPAPEIEAGRHFGYFSPAPGQIAFVLPLEHGCDIDPARDLVYVAGDFNGWEKAVGAAQWLLTPAELDGEKVLMWGGPAQAAGLPEPRHFKFVTGDHLWLGTPDDAPNAVERDGYRNRLLDPARTGRHLWRFTLAAPLDLARRWSVAAEPAPGAPRVPLVPGRFFHELSSALPLGAIAGRKSAVFRLFAPRASSVTLYLCQDAARQDQAQAFALGRREDRDGAAGVWEIQFEESLHGWFYWYRIDGVRDGPGGFDPGARVLDPYALAALGPSGPGIVLERSWVGKGDRDFATPAWHDLVIAEAHVRDLCANAPVPATPEERLGFTGLTRWVERPGFYLHHLGVNCVELQPVQEFDAPSARDYHWGYMPCNFFAPASSYSLDPARASGVRELQALVRALHARGIAVILDVVYNHVGVPAHLARVDELYYFERDAGGAPSNWSGCGNDLRASAAMAARLITDSCRHLIEAYGVDGFRFDLAELLGVEVLRGIEAGLKRCKPDVILIAEPWSFRGHIAGQLRDTGWASWNDGYRDFVRDYVRGAGSAERLEYFLRGSPWYFAKWPAQTVNYTESHDDRTWLDSITENPGGDGSAPTPNDRRRTHLMAAVLFLSVGIPMLAEGQDFLRSKRGVSNTYLRGDLNALDYRRLHRHLATHAYFADWIGFRRGHHGRLLRHFSRPAEGFLRFFRGERAEPLAVLYNADGSQGSDRILFAINPLGEDAGIPVGAEAAGAGPWRQIGDQERFYRGLEGAGGLEPVEADLVVPAMSCRLWVIG
jgi:pullulanase